MEGPTEIFSVVGFKGRHYSTPFVVEQSNTTLNSSYRDKCPIFRGKSTTSYVLCLDGVCESDSKG